MQSSLELAGKRVTVAGLGRFGGGVAVARWLVQQGAKVLVTDKAQAATLADSVEQLRGLPVAFRLGGHDLADFTETDLLVVNPAIPPSEPLIAAAKNAGVPLTTEMCLFAERCPAYFTFGVTGTKGKSTTSTMLGLMLGTGASGARRVWFGGNIGVSLLANLHEIRAEDLVVLELSSYMLHYLGEVRFSPHVAVVTFIGTDHIEWHGSRESYWEAKKNITRFQGPEDVAVVSANNLPSRSFGDLTPGRVLTYDLDDHPFDLAIPGRHNQLNAEAAYVAASLIGVSRQHAQAAVSGFRGLPHRLELVHEAAGVRWFNDSIATIPEAAMAAHNAFEPGTVIQIVGGYDKHLDMAAMCKHLGEQAKAVLTIGQLGPTLAEAAGPRATFLGDLKSAVDRARELAAPGDVVLMSPGCASYDQFNNFQERGELFAKLARTLPE
ncbi:MAG: UDP-N-acetylmuramoyl-L-alanine--D-glutamate ligase [Phycisphaerae bacterium]